MIRQQRRLHRWLWLLMLPMLGAVIYVAVVEQEEPPISQAPIVIEEARLP